jgi:hypothetical protein
LWKVKEGWYEVRKVEKAGEDCWRLESIRNVEE